MDCDASEITLFNLSYFSFFASSLAGYDPSRAHGVECITCMHVFVLFALFAVVDCDNYRPDIYYNLTSI